MKNKLLVLILSSLLGVNSSFSQSIVKRSKVCGYADSYEMTISNHGSDTAIISNVAVTPITSDLVALYTIDGSIDSSYYVSWPNNGTYWYVHFNPSLGPQKLPPGAGSTGPVICNCTGTGACKVVPLSSGGAGCTNESCDHCCEEDEGPMITNSGGGILIKAVSIKLNGTTYY
jgi:hypothetical protein